MKEVLNKLLSIQMTLDTIPVTGRDNVAHMLGCMQALNEAIAIIRKQEEKKQCSGRLRSALTSSIRPGREAGLT